METIAAIATAQSPSAIGIVRLSGEETRRSKRFRTAA